MEGPCLVPPPTPWPTGPPSQKTRGISPGSEALLLSILIGVWRRGVLAQWAAFLQLLHSLGLLSGFSARWLSPCTAMKNEIISSVSSKRGDTQASLHLGDSVWGMAFFHVDNSSHSPIAWQKVEEGCNQLWNCLVLEEGLCLLGWGGKRVIICFWHYQRHGLGKGVPWSQTGQGGFPWVSLTDLASWTPGFPKWVLGRCRGSKSLFPE